LKSEKPSKTFILDWILDRLAENPDLSILDLGSGDSHLFQPVFERYPDVAYVGVEPGPAAASAKARTTGCSRAKIVQAPVPENSGLAPAFDIVVSLSVLEHVKHLDRFLQYSAEKVRDGGWLIHLYDLGHALYPSSAQERLHVLLCRLPGVRALVPETRFVRYVSQAAVERVLEGAGIRITRRLHHNVPQLVSLLKRLPDEEDTRPILDAVIELEQLTSPLVEKLPVRPRELLFPGISLWGKKNPP